jgi:hypothetical protein
MSRTFRGLLDVPLFEEQRLHMRRVSKARGLPASVAVAVIFVLSAGCVPEGMVLVGNEEQLRQAKGLPTARDSTPERIWLWRHRVISALSTAYRVLHAIQPPEAPEMLECGAVLDRFMVAIEPKDEWRVTHKIGTEYLIQSKTFTDRLCRHISGSSSLANERLGICSVWRDFAIAISADGTITRGWESLEKHNLTGNRHLLGPIDASGWPPGVVFVPSTK